MTARVLRVWDCVLVLKCAQGLVSSSKGVPGTNNASTSQRCVRIACAVVALAPWQSRLDAEPDELGSL
jgi:hypothetical protein